MRHPLVQFMLTPMAAPETVTLRRLRFAWSGVCCALLLGVTANGALVATFGPKGAIPALLLTVATPLVGLFYFRAKTHADAAHASGDANAGGEP